MFALVSSSIWRAACGFGGLAVILTLATLAVAACGDDPVKVGPSLGTIEVRTITQGVALAPDSFEVQIKGSKSGNTGPNDLYYVMNLPRGYHQIGLKETPSNCRFESNPRSILVTPNETAETTFQIFCE